uniref:Uncharacterized protein n=1 Tax=Eutreptiella gymnastica TaxID=73025 RepID=A0A7S4FS62_9EUGL
MVERMSTKSGRVLVKKWRGVLLLQLFQARVLVHFSRAIYCERGPARAHIYATTERQHPHPAAFQSGAGLGGGTMRWEELAHRMFIPQATAGLSHHNGRTVFFAGVMLGALFPIPESPSLEPYSCPQKEPPDASSSLPPLQTTTVNPGPGKFACTELVVWQPPTPTCKS